MKVSVRWLCVGTIRKEMDKIITIAGVAHAAVV
jgi:hypothetical protein